MVARRSLWGSPTGAPDPIVNLATARTFTDSEGVEWTRRGGRVDQRRLLRLLNDPEVVVIHDYLGDQIVVEPAERAAFWADAQALMADSIHSDFYGSEFKNVARLHLLVIHQDC